MSYGEKPKKAFSLKVFTKILFLNFDVDFFQEEVICNEIISKVFLVYVYFASKIKILENSYFSVVRKFRGLS